MDITFELPAYHIIFISFNMYKYFAFISYSSKDVDWGKRVQKKLEGYRMPSTLCSQHGWSLWERITKSNHKDVTYYKGLLLEYTKDLLMVMRQDFLEELTGKYIKNKTFEED